MNTPPDAGATVSRTRRGELGNFIGAPRPLHFRRAHLEADARVRRHPLPRLADPEEHGPDGAGRAAARGARASRRGRGVGGAGRTDAGVHALAQVAHLKARRELPTREIHEGLNDRLPFDVNVLAVEKASPRFHARHDARSRTYLYRVSRRRTAFDKRLVWWVKDRLDLGRDAEGGPRSSRAVTTSRPSARTRRGRSRRSSSSRRAKRSTWTPCRRSTSASRRRTTSGRWSGD